MNAVVGETAPELVNLPQRARPNWSHVKAAQDQAEHFENLWVALKSTFAVRDAEAVELERRLAEALRVGWKWAMFAGVVGFIVGGVLAKAFA